MSGVMWGAYEQVGNTIPLWTDVGVDRALGGFAIPMTWFQALNPLLVITMTPLLLLHWRRQADAGRDTPPARKMAIGALMVAGAYLLLATVSTSVGADRASWLWLFLFFVILTLGELTFCRRAWVCLRGWRPLASERPPWQRGFWPSSAAACSRELSAPSGAGRAIPFFSFCWPAWRQGRPSCCRCWTSRSVDVRQNGLGFSYLA